MNTEKLYQSSVELLQNLIKTPSFSKEESQTALIIEEYLSKHAIEYERSGNNVWGKNLYFDPSKPTVLLNSHHDTVKPNESYTRNPFDSSIENGILYGLGSNDAGGALVSLMALFIHFYSTEGLPYNLIFAATAEEEISGKNGVESILKQLPPVEFAIVGEPTLMNMAISEKGLLVIDGYAKGNASHAAHENPNNAIYNALKDINLIKEIEFDRSSDHLGEVKCSVTQINAGKQHNVVPDSCHFVVDVRVNEHYTNEQVFNTLDRLTKSQLKARSFRLNSSSIPENHPVVMMGKQLGLTTYGSPTLSDQALLPYLSLKMGPGDSKRSHSADEFIYLHEIEEAIETYINLFNKLFKTAYHETLG